MILLDTSFIISYYNTRDENHGRAKILMEKIAAGKYGATYVTDCIFDESLTVGTFRIKYIGKSVEIGKAIRSSSELLKINDLLFEASWDIFRSQKRPRFSFTDCTTLAVLAKTGIRDIATFDGDFKSVGTLNVIS